MNKLKKEHNIKWEKNGAMYAELECRSRTRSQTQTSHRAYYTIHEIVIIKYISMIDIQHTYIWNIWRAKNNYTLKMIELWRRLKFIEPPFAEPFVYVWELNERNTLGDWYRCVLLYVKKRNIDGIVRARVQHFASSFIVYHNKYSYVYDGFYMKFYHCMESLNLFQFLHM